MPRFERAIVRIDAANAEDPHKIAVDGTSRPAEVVYAERMTATLALLYPNASEALQLAARAQHLRRWTVPRDTYPMDRAGYHRWRNDLKKKHADWAGALLAECGYSSEEIARVGQLIRKEHIKEDAEAQALEDTACLVFLEHYSGDFAAKHADPKLLGILKKTWAKMSLKGQTAAHALQLPPRLAALLARAIAGPAEAGATKT